ncbi:MAG: HEAT repeat domain-containing protein [Treponema sp.]|jgi:plasmid stability protein|nr:HEAT repeat domain-containing protein [Treponema sp.]
MITRNHVLAAVVAGLLTVSLVSAQEMSVEESYLQESIENMIIREQSQADGRDMKLVALEYIAEAINHGNTSDDVRNALEYLSLEGITNQTRENGRLINNFPDVRARAATYLGEIGTPEAKNTLLKIMLAENEPMVLTEAVKSLAKIGLNENEETTNTISWVITRFDVLNPDNLLALSALEAYEILAKKNGGLKDPSAIRTILRIADGRYIKPVQDRARQLIFELRQYGNNGNSGR